MNLSALLLAGVKSRRMGVDKATLVIAGRPLWQRQLGMLRDLRPKSLWVSATSVPPWCPVDIPVVVDQPPSHGPLSGVAAGLRRLQSSHLLVLAIDLPKMQLDHLLKLWALAGPGSGVIPRNGDHLEPLCAIYPRAAVVAAEESLRGHRASVQDFGQKLQICSQARFYELTFTETLMYLNMNTPADVPSGVQPGADPTNSHKCQAAC
jgi:molybdopterin-guanine dinucleotide biosynthesis protein A